MNVLQRLLTANPHNRGAQDAIVKIASLDTHRQNKLISALMTPAEQKMNGLLTK